MSTTHIVVHERKKGTFFVTFILTERNFFKHLFLISMYSILNELSEYMYLYISKNISYTFSLLFKFSKAYTVKRWNSKKVSKSNDIQLRITKEVSDILRGFRAKNFNKCLDKGFFLDEPKYAELVPVYKKMIKRIRITTGLSVFCLIYQNCIKDVCNNKFMNILDQFYQNFSMVSDNDSVQKIAIKWWSKAWKK